MVMPGQAEGLAPETETEAELADKKPETQKLDLNGSAGKLIYQEARLGEFERRNSSPALPFSPGTSLKLHGNILEQDLAIEWDRWHNRFARAVRDGMFSNRFEAINMPPGLITWYHCEVNSQMNLQNVRISKSSGNFWYDKAVIDAVRKLDGSPVLKFPDGSKRSDVSADIGIRLGGPASGELKFNDVEYRQLKPEEVPVQETEKADEKKKKKSKSEKR